MQADSIAELASKVGIDEVGLIQTLSTYNKAVETGEDSFKRTTLTHTFGQPTTISEGPYYAMETVTAMLATYAGIHVNEYTAVLNPYEEVIPKLYAAGEVVAGFHGAGYMTGSSLGKAAIFGRIAAKQALALNKEVVQ